jgi:DNA-binding transcriptional LysR family regulator
MRGGRSAINLRRLEAFRAVMIAGSITRAGRLLSISQPAVTRLVRDLELDLGLTLFARNGSTVVPTPEAHAVYSEVDRLFINTERLRDAAERIRDGGIAHVHITAIPAMSVSVLPNAIGAFLEESPATLVSIHSGASIDIVDTVASGQVDIGFIARPPDRNDLVFEPMPLGEVVCILPVAHPLVTRQEIGPADLDGQDYVALGAGSLMRLELAALLHKAGAHPRMRVESLFSGTVVHYVERGIGIAIVDPLVAATIDPARAAVRRFRPVIDYELSVVFAPRVVRSPTLSRLIHHVTAAYVRAVDEVEALVAS